MISGIIEIACVRFAEFLGVVLGACTCPNYGSHSCPQSCHEKKKFGCTCFKYTFIFKMCFYISTAYLALLLQHLLYWSLRPREMAGCPGVRTFIDYYRTKMKWWNTSNPLGLMWNAVVFPSTMGISGKSFDLELQSKDEESAVYHGCYDTEGVPHTKSGDRQPVQVSIQVSWDFYAGLILLLTYDCVYGRRCSVGSNKSWYFTFTAKSCVRFSFGFYGKR